MSVTVQGADAQAQCNSFLRQTTDGGSWYIYSGGQRPAGASICQITYRGDLFTVRDEGALDIYGNGICKNLTDLANGRPIPTTAALPKANSTEMGVYPVCGLQVAGHDATVILDLPQCAAFARDYPPADGHWTNYTGAAPSGDRLICQGDWKGDGTLWGRLAIYDSGGAYYATDLCKRLGW